MAKCPNCQRPIAWDTGECAHCGSVFAGAEAWRPLPESPEESRYLAEKYQPLAPVAVPDSGHARACRAAALVTAVTGSMYLVAFFLPLVTYRKGHPHEFDLLAIILSAAIFIPTASFFLTVEGYVRRGKAIGIAILVNGLLAFLSAWLLLYLFNVPRAPQEWGAYVIILVVSILVTLHVGALIALVRVRGKQ